MNERHQQYLAQLMRRADDAVDRHGLRGVRAEVVFVLDVSKSMYAMYKSQAVHELATRLLALSLEFDDDGTIPAYAFGDSCRHLGNLTKDDFPGWVEREVIRTGADFQNSCNYAPVINEVCSYFFPEDWHLPTSEVKVGRIFKKTTTLYPTLSAPRALPVYALFVTSGDCQDQEATADVVRRASRLPIFWQFVGLQSGKGNPTRFKFLEKLDNLGNTHVDNCGFFEVTDTRNDTLLFEGMVKEFPHYLQKAEVNEMLLPEEEGGLRTKGDRELPVESRGADTAQRLAYDEQYGTEAAESADSRAAVRRAAEQRALARRSERSNVNVKATDGGPVGPRVAPKVAPAMKPDDSRTVKAVADTRTVKAMAAETRNNVEAMQDDGGRPPVGARGTIKSSPDQRLDRVTVEPDEEAPLPDRSVPDSLARRIRRLQTDSGASKVEPAQMPRRASRLEMSVAEAEAHVKRATERTVIRAAASDEFEREQAQAEPTMTVHAHEDEEEDTPEARMRAARAQRQTRRDD